MSFFNKLKQGLGISTAKAELQIPATIAKDSTGVNGKVVITAQSDALSNVCGAACLLRRRPSLSSFS